MTCALAVLLAAGMSIPDLGAAALGQGAATVARPADLTALYYNPAGLASQEGLRFQLDVRAVQQAVTFQRLTADGGNPNNFALVSNSGGPSVGPIVAAARHFDLFGMPATVALGGIPSSGASGYRYPDPSALRASGLSDEEVARLAPQRYTSISSTSKIYVVSLGLAARPLPWLDLGAALQLHSALLSASVAVSAAPLAGEYSGFDAVVHLDAHDYLRPSGVFGASAQLPLGLVFGAALQLPVTFHASGTITADLPPAAASLGAAVTGDQAEASVTFPLVARAGLRLQRTAFEVELAGTFERWSSLREIRVDPKGIYIDLLGNRTTLPTISLRKDLTNAGSLRLGGEWHAGESFAVLRGLTFRAGALGETSAVPEERQTLDVAHWERLALTAGATLRLGRFDATLGYAHFFQPVRKVRDSQVVQVTALPGVPGDVVGNGDFSSQIDALAASVVAVF